MKGVHGGYHADGRLEAARDEIAIELMEALRARTPEEKRRAFKEVVRLGREYVGLLTHLNGGQPPLGFAGA